jgi:hypothetical protein
VVGVTRDTFILDLFSGPGGVGYAIDRLGFRHVGVDIVDYSGEYPGEFVHADASWLPFMERFPSPDLLWLSPPCLAYTRLTNAAAGRYGWDQSPRERYPTFDDLGVRDLIDVLDPAEYIIENVPTCEDLHDPVRLNGHGFDLPFRMERHFETSFGVPECRGWETPELVVSEGYNRERMAAAKGVPSHWPESAIHSAIPREYVKYLLHYCPATPGVPLPDSAPGDTTLTDPRWSA